MGRHLELNDPRIIPGAILYNEVELFETTEARLMLSEIDTRILIVRDQQNDIRYVHVDGCGTRDGMVYASKITEHSAIYPTQLDAIRDAFDHERDYIRRMTDGIDHIRRQLEEIPVERR